VENKRDYKKTIMMEEKYQPTPLLDGGNYKKQTKPFFGDGENH
jgi:hypothetical protein